MSFGIAFWGNSTDSHKIFKLQKRAVRIIAGVRSRESCRPLFNKLKILPLACQYIYVLVNFLLCNRENFEINSTVHSINTRQKNDFHKPSSNLSIYQKGVRFAGIKLFNSLPTDLKIQSENIKLFRTNLKKYLITHTFYSVDEFMTHHKVV